LVFLIYLIADGNGSFWIAQWLFIAFNLMAKSNSQNHRQNGSGYFRLVAAAVSAR
jgi:hypothetical protein